MTVPETQFADAEFKANRVSGFSGCNTFDALYRSGGRTLFIGVPASTFMACSEEANAFESAYLAGLEASRFYSERRGTLTIFDAQGSTILVFDAAPQNPVLGNWIVDSFATAPGALAAPIEGTSLTAVFGIASVGGSAGCNQYTGTYGTNGNVVRVGRLATTRIACADEIMAQETAFLAAMEGAALIDRRGPTLMLTDIGGSIARRPGATVARAGHVARPSAEASETPEATPTATPTAEPTAEPTPTARPTATPTPAPTLPPRPTPAPTVEPPPSIPPTATCDLAGSAGQALASILYPASWSTLDAPPELACRYFDPEPITVPADPTTLQTAVEVDPLGHAIRGRDQRGHRPGVLGRHPAQGRDRWDAARDARRGRGDRRYRGRRRRHIQLRVHRRLRRRRHAHHPDDRHGRRPGLCHEHRCGDADGGALDVHAAGLTPGHTAAATIGRDGARPYGARLAMSSRYASISGTERRAFSK